MLKKLLIVVVCLVTVCAVLGLHDNLSYDGIEHSLSIIRGSADDIPVDIDGFRLVLAAVRVYDPTKEQSQLGWSINSEDDPYKYTIWIGEQGFQEDPDLYGESLIFTNADVTTPEFQRAYNLVRRFLHDPVSGGLFEAVDYLRMTLIYIGAVLSALAYLVGDFIGVAFSVVEAAFYLLGF